MLSELSVFARLQAQVWINLLQGVGIAASNLGTRRIKCACRYSEPCATP